MERSIKKLIRYLIKASENEDKYIIAIDGVTSSRLELRKYIDFIIFVDTPYNIRLSRGIERDAIEAKEIWINN